MTWRTHALAGVNALWTLALLPPEWLQGDFGTLAACAAFGAFLPDLDAVESKIKHLAWPGCPIQPFAVIAEFVHHTDRHRGMLHSLTGWAFMAAVPSPTILILGWTCYAALLLGYGSHLLADACTKSGISPLYPRTPRRHALPPLLRVTTGSEAEEALQIGLAVGALALLLSRMPLRI